MKKFWSFLVASWFGLTAGSALLWQTSTEVEAAPVGETPAVSCRAATLALAQNLRWDHIRVWNTATFPVWVVCPVTNNTEWWTTDDGTLKWYGPGTGSLSVWFGGSAAASSQVLCTWLDLDPDITDTAAANFVTHTVSAPEVRPGVVDQSFDLSLFNGYYPNTITCRLDPQTGLNNYQILYSKELL
jgi:hypothetical protein